MPSDRKAPPCFKSDHAFGLWQSAAKLAGQNRDGYCRDCLPSYKAEMQLQERCKYPKVAFVPAGEIRGVQKSAVEGARR